MKKTTFSLSILALGLLSCEEPQTQIKDLLGNDRTKKEIFHKITSNEELMREFTTIMVNSGSASQVFQENPDMVNHLINNDGMVDLLKNNPQAKEHMITMMMQDTLFNSELIRKAIMDNKNTAKMVKQLEASKIITKGCAAEANKVVTNNFKSALIKKN